MKRFVAITIHYKDPARIRKLVRAAASWTATPDRLIIVDNSGDLGNVSSPDIPVQIISMPSNAGYAGAVNAGIDAIPPAVDAVLVLTQDAELQSDCAEMLLMSLQSDTKVGAVGPLLLDAKAPTKVFSSGGTLSSHGVTHHANWNKNANSIAPASIHSEVDWIDGAVMLLDVNAIATIGLLDPRFFLYVEDVDYMLRLRLEQFRVLVCARAIARQSAGNYRWYLKYRNHLYLVSKHTNILNKWPWRRQLLIDILTSLRHATIPHIWSAICGVRAAKSGRMGPPPDRMK